jgi:hypothetical protein
VVHLRATLTGVAMPVWRRLEVSSRATLLELHATLQRAFGQFDTAAHQFVIDGVEYHGPDPELDSSHATDRTDLRAIGLQRGDRFTHTVETSELPWVHELVVENRTARLINQRVPWCVEGEGASPPDDCDGPERYEALLAAYHAPQEPRHAALREWLPPDFDPGFVDLTAINAELGKLPKQRLDD